MGDKGLFSYYQSFNKLVAELGPGALAIDTQVHYFIEGLDNNAVRNTMQPQLAYATVLRV
jgi:hypothetical protein